MEIGDRIRLVRQATKKDITAFAELLSISQSGLSKIENNKQRPQYDFLGKICELWNVSPAYLLTGEGEMFVNPSQSSKDSKIKQLYPTPSQNSSEQDEEILLTLMLSVDEWLKEEGLTMDPDKKINLIKLLRKFYTEHTDKITTDSVKNYAIPFALKLIN